MSKYYVYHCSVSEIDITENVVNTILEAHTEDSQVHINKEDALIELRNILDKHCIKSLQLEIDNLNRKLK